MRKLLTLFLLFFSLGLFAQEFIQEEKPEPVKKENTLRDRLFFGGGFGMAFGTITNIEVAPVAGFRITDDWMAGGGFTYQYSSNNRGNISGTIYGPRLFTNYLLIGDFFAHLEYEVLSVSSTFFYLGSNERFRVESYLVGGGYRMYINDKSSVNIMLLYNLNEARYTPYVNPVIRIGFYF